MGCAEIVAGGPCSTVDFAAMLLHPASAISADAIVMVAHNFSVRFIYFTSSGTVLSGFPSYLLSYFN